MERNHIDAVMIRNIYSFTYFTGIPWWQPAVLIPLREPPTIFAFEDEVEELREKTWIDKILGYRKVEELMRAVTSNIRQLDVQTLGFDIDIDASALLFEQFRNLNPGKKIVNVHSLIMKLRMIKDPTEIELIRKASEIAKTSLETAINAVSAGVTETAIAGEVEYAARKQGAESILVYVNAGKPRIHAHPMNKEVKKGDAVMIDVMPAFGGYFSDIAHTVFVGSASNEQKKAFQAFHEAVETYVAELKPGLKLNELEEKIQEVYKRHGVEKYYVYGFAHGVGLRFEEDPITTIIVPHRATKVEENMVLNVGHAPLTGKEIGTIKIEDTVLVRKEKAEKFVDFRKELLEV
jgi:Xaa-Pro aminopeptidase